ncbi:protein bicaudal C homolog 1 isoform X2 [Pieris rapae]|uniref:protein bicaudal C homolog 1 isoform X2 n=1 Tax=Pieris rapae TaxID=64459 RepID=UPI000B92BB1A|nr:protein bicaudal C homolog 1 isoform X2 [Pieris rapae]
MESSNFLNVKTHVSELRNADKDSVSEASESGTSNSVTSAEDLQNVALILGLANAEDVHQERFRVDRRRLEGMLADNLDVSQTAQAFFQKVMDETRTVINWPARLKIGARSKKDPHVRISGLSEDVKLAREKIMQLLDTRSNRVTMKIDVSYTDHSHIIGKGGLTIKRVMEETGCHIHFPDSNRTSAVEKSNQVSIAGDMERVERARARVRALTPLIFTFELPVVGASNPLPEITSPYVQQIQDKFNVQVMLRNRPKLHANLVVVKGVQWEVQATMEATTLLLNYLCGQHAKQTHVQMTLEISPMHHPVVVGRSSEQLKVIMRTTGAQIMFPDAEDPNIPTLRKSCVTITGAIQNVYAARQQLVGSLPLVVIFDVPDDMSQRFENDNVTELMNKFNVYISVRRKLKQGIASIVIKGIERCAGDIYEARRELLGKREASLNAEIPESYNIPSLTNVMPNFPPFNPFSPSHSSVATNSPSSPFLRDFSSYGSPMYGQHPPTPGGFPAPMSPAIPVYGNWLIPSPQPSTSQFHYPMPGTSAPYQGPWNSISGNGESNVSSNNMMQQYPGNSHPPNCESRPISLTQLLNSSSACSSGYQSNFTGSSVSIDAQNISAGAENSVVSPSVSPISKSAVSPAQSSENDQSQQQELANLILELKNSDRRAPGCEKKTLETIKQLSPLSEYKKLQQEANKAMRENIGSGYRVPTTRWSGHYFSNTMPATNEPEPGSSHSTPDKQCNILDLKRMSIVDNCATPPKAKPCRYQQLYDMLQDIGLQKYIDLFKTHELDMQTFASLNDADLIEIGVTAFGARRKMLLTIAKLQKQASTSGSVTPNRNLMNSPPQYNTNAISKDNW